MSLLFVNPMPCTARRRRTAAITRQQPRACETSLAETNIDKLFTRLTHVNANLRKKACAELAEIGTEETITRLTSLLHLEDTIHRRAAVQALGMTGTSVIPPIVDMLRHSSNSTVRASCSKVLAAVALYFPESRKDFPDEALSALEMALGQDPDPVTKIASVGCLGTLGSDCKTPDGPLSGNDRAVEVLVGLCGNTLDMAVGATVVGAVAQIGQNGSSERKAWMVEVLKKLSESDEDDSDTGFAYVKEMAVSHLDQLEGGTKIPEE